MENKITVKEFVDKYNKTSSKKTFIKNSIQRKYIPYGLKRIVLQESIDKSMMTFGDVSMIDHVKATMNFELAMCVAYYDLVFEDDDYDLLVSSGLMPMLLEELKGELDVAKRMYDDVIKNWENIHMSSTATIYKVASGFIDTFQNILNVIGVEDAQNIIAQSQEN